MKGPVGCSLCTGGLHKPTQFTTRYAAVNNESDIRVRILKRFALSLSLIVTAFQRLLLKMVMF